MYGWVAARQALGAVDVRRQRVRKWPVSAIYRLWVGEYLTRPFLRKSCRTAIGSSISRTRLVRHFATAGGELANVGGVDEIQQKPCALVDPRTFS